MLCTAASVRTLVFPETQKPIVWVHCKGFQVHGTVMPSEITTTTYLIPASYVVALVRHTTFVAVSSKATVDIGLFPPSHPDPIDGKSVDFVRKYISSLHLTETGSTDPDPLYDGFITDISQWFGTAIADIKAVNNFDLGDEFEIAMCKVLERVLPQRFSLCRGHVFSAYGDQAGDDIIIYDRMRFPTLRSLNATDYSRMERVPIEAVYAYIEAKHTLTIRGHDGQSLQKALHQVSDVKRLCGIRPSVPLTQVAPHTVIPAATVESHSLWPDHRNPVYAEILARNVRITTDAQICTDPSRITQELLSVPLETVIAPDLIVAGQDNLLLPAIQNTKTGSGDISSPFHIPTRSHFSPVRVMGNGFGVGLACLLWALDWIQLGEMPWPAILKDCLRTAPT